MTTTAQQQLITGGLIGELGVNSSLVGMEGLLDGIAGGSTSNSSDMKYTTFMYNGDPYGSLVGDTLLINIVLPASIRDLIGTDPFPLQYGRFKPLPAAVAGVTITGYALTVQVYSELDPTPGWGFMILQLVSGTQTLNINLSGGLETITVPSDGSMGYAISVLGAGKAQVLNCSLEATYNVPSVPITSDGTIEFEDYTITIDHPGGPCRAVFDPPTFYGAVYQTPFTYSVSGNRLTPNTLLSDAHIYGNDIGIYMSMYCGGGDVHGLAGGTRIPLQSGTSLYLHNAELVSTTYTTNGLTDHTPPLLTTLTYHAVDVYMDGRYYVYAPPGFTIGARWTNTRGVVLRRHLVHIAYEDIYGTLQVAYGRTDDDGVVTFPTIYACASKVHMGMGLESGGATLFPCTAYDGLDASDFTYKGLPTNSAPFPPPTSVADPDYAATIPIVPTGKDYGVLSGDLRPDVVIDYSTGLCAIAHTAPPAADAATNHAVSGVVGQFTDLFGNTETLTTDSTGMAFFNDLDPNTITSHAITTPGSSLGVCGSLGSLPIFTTPFVPILPGLGGSSFGPNAPLIGNESIEPTCVYQFFVDETVCSATGGGGHVGSGIAALIDYTHRLHVYSITSGGALQANLYNDVDASPTTVTIDSGSCAYPAFYRAQTHIVGTYLKGTTPRLARSQTHGREWQTMDVPGTYDAQASAYHKGRIIFLGWKTSDHNWYCRVGKPEDDATITWSDEAMTGISGSNGSGKLLCRDDGVLVFAWADNSGAHQITYGRGIGNNGGNASCWTAS